MACAGATSASVLEVAGPRRRILREPVCTPVGRRGVPRRVPRWVRRVAAHALQPPLVARAAAADAHLHGAAPSSSPGIYYKHSFVFNYGFIYSCTRDTCVLVCIKCYKLEYRSYCLRQGGSVSGSSGGASNGSGLCADLSSEIGAAISSPPPASPAGHADFEPPAPSPRAQAPPSHHDSTEDTDYNKVVWRAWLARGGCIRDMVCAS